VISGYLISGIIFDEIAKDTFGLKAFYVRRILRIFPALLVTIAAVLAAGSWLLFPIDFIRLGQQAMASVAFVANFYFWSQAGYFNASAETYPLLHLWSPGVEEQFYIAWPLMLLGLCRYPKPVLPTILIAGAGSLLYAVGATDRPAAFYFPFARAWQLLLGAALAWLSAHQYQPSRSATALSEVSGLALVVGAGFFIHDDASYPGWNAFAPTAGEALLLWSAGAGQIVAPILSSAPLRFLGKISYALYLWHWPLFWFYRQSVSQNLTAGPALLLCLSSVVLAYLTTTLIENPIRFRAPKAIAIRSLVAVQLSLLAAAALVLRDGWPGRWPSEIVNLLTYNFDISIYRIGKCHLKETQGPSEFAGECFVTDASNDRNVVVWGDSVATALHPGLDQLNKDQKNRLALSELTASGCPPLIVNYVTLPERPLCPAVNAYVMSYWRKTPRTR
jgi:peptidoglycan/LPS O-acetylase OafA/YrhL